MNNYKTTDEDKGDFPFTNFWDLAKYYQQSRARNAYTGWEGFADPFVVFKKRKIPALFFDYLLKQHEDRDADEEGFQIRCDILMHIIFESLDQAGHLMTNKEIETTMIAIDTILGSRYFKPSGIKWKIENGLLVPSDEEDKS